MSDRDGVGAEGREEVIITPGDIVGVRGVGWLSDGIIKAEYGNNPPANAISHVGIVIGANPPTVIEALNRVMTRPLSVTIADAAKAFILHDRLLTDEQRAAIVEKACTFSADDYGYADLLAQLLDAQFGTFWFTDRMSWLLRHWPICSYVVAASYHVAVQDFGVTDASCKPSDIMDYAVTRPFFDVTAIK